MVVTTLSFLLDKKANLSADGTNETHTWENPSAWQKPGVYDWSGRNKSSRFIRPADRAPVEWISQGCSSGQCGGCRRVECEVDGRLVVNILIIRIIARWAEF
jgi:hypothetical protein